jgi:hypothetical protein
MWVYSSFCYIVVYSMANSPVFAMVILGPFFVVCNHYFAKYNRCGIGKSESPVSCHYSLRPTDS